MGRKETEMATTLDNRHTLALPYWARPGFMLREAPADGGGNDDEGDDEEEDDDEEEEDDPDADKSPEELKAELVKARAALKKANGESQRGRTSLKTRVKDLEKELDEARNGGAGGDEDKGKKVDEVALNRAVERARKEGRQEGETAGNTRIIRTEARAALAAKGAPADRLKKLVGLIDFEGLELDDDGVIGLDDAIDELVTEWPELFSAKKVRRIGGGSGRRGDDEGSKKAMTATERQVAELAKARR
jgi:hypothetical protein